MGLFLPGLFSLELFVVEAHVMVRFCRVKDYSEK
jgi:hypothetical protein